MSLQMVLQFAVILVALGIGARVGWLSKERLDELLKPENMTHPRLNP